jgi:hypothetical protein
VRQQMHRPNEQAKAYCTTPGSPVTRFENIFKWRRFYYLPVNCSKNRA